MKVSKIMFGFGVFLVVAVLVDAVRALSFNLMGFNKIWNVIIGFLFMILAEAFKKGTQLCEDQKLTI